MCSKTACHAALHLRLASLMLTDQYHLDRQLKHLAREEDPLKHTQKRQAIEQKIIEAQQRVQARQASGPFDIQFPQDLPVSHKQPEISQAISQHQVVIIAGETGSGKTTQIPKICLEVGLGIRGIIGHTQPRRLAARTVAKRIAEELNTELGEAVGYKIRFNDTLSEQSKIKLMTDGVLLAEIQQDSLLLQYDTLIIDEAHERSLNIDFLLGYFKQLLPRRPDLKLIITSATIDPLRFSAHFNRAPVIEVSGRTFPVELRYRPLNEGKQQQDQLQGITDAIDELSSEGPGDILIFMSGEREIRDTARALQQLQLRHTEVVPLYARLSNSEQNRIFQPHSGRRIVLATNVAETSLTVPGIKYVIDPGYARLSRYSHRTKVQRLPIEPISQASANQRKGRCGRVSAGICIRLYSQADFDNRPPFTDPEILRTNLASVILQMTALGLGAINDFPFIEKPDTRNIQDGIRLLEELGALQKSAADGPGYYLTLTGRQLARLPVDPRLARMILAAAKTGCMQEVMVIAAALSIQDPRERPADKKQAADEKHLRFADKASDFISWINLWNYIKEQQQLGSSQFRRLCQHEFLNYLRIREWQDIYTQLRQVVRELGLSLSSQPAAYREIHCAILSGLLSQLGQKDLEKNEYTGCRQTKFALFPASALFKKPPKWLMVAELVETSRLWGRMAAHIEPEWVEPIAQHLLKYSYSEPHWQKRQGSVMAMEKVSLLGLPIVNQRRVNYGKIDPQLCRQLFIRHALVEGDWQTNHQFMHHNQQLRQEIEDLENKSRRRDILVEDDTLYQFYDQRVPSQVVSARHFDKWWNKQKKQQPDLLNFDKSVLIKDNATSVSALDFPDYWHQGSLKLALSYQFQPGMDRDGVTVHIPLPLLNQVEQRGFEWQVPGLRQFLVVSLIKSLPKPMRRHLVPAPDFATAFLGRVTDSNQPLLSCLQQVFLRMTGVVIDSEQWNWQQVPEHLKITFRVEGEHQQTLAESKNLAELKTLLKQQVIESLTEINDSPIEQNNIQSWSFGELPQRLEQQRGGYQLQAYPALVDEKQSVAIRLFDNQQQQQQQMWQGVRRLLLLNIPSPVKFLHEKLPNKAKLGLYFNPYGKVLDLIDDCINCAIDKLMTLCGGLVWDEQGFLQLKETVRAELNSTVIIIAQQVEQILTAVFAINKKLKGRVDMTLALALTDIKNQLQGLIYPGFVTGNGWQHLADTLRYIKGIERRLQKLPLDPHSDRAKMLQVQKLEQDFRAWRNKLTPVDNNSDKVQQIRWLIEELRISLFAQQLGTVQAVSEKRIRQLLVD